MPAPTPQNSATPRPGPIEFQRLEQRFAQRLETLRAQLVSAEPAQVAQSCGAQYKPGGTEDAPQSQISLEFWGHAIRITCPEWIAYPEGGYKPLSAFDQALLLYYLTTADGEPLSQEWISFSDLPDGRFYNQAFQGYTGKELARAFHNDQTAFEAAAQVQGGVRYPLGSAAFAFLALPRVPLLAVYWQGDEDFPSTCQVLFDAAASHYLPTDAYAILGSTLTRRLIKTKE